ncbi:MAG: hypothetical protein QXI38_05000 [Conexivisphaerales archaeon]
MPRFYEEVMHLKEEINKAVETLDYDEGLRTNIIYENRQATLFITRGVIRGYSIAIYDFSAWPAKEQLYFGSFEDPDSVLKFAAKYINGKVYKY